MMRNCLKFVSAISLLLLVACSSNPKVDNLQTLDEQRDPQQWLNMASANQDKGNHRRALRAYEEVLAVEPDNVAALKGAAVTLNKLGRYEKSLDYTQRVLNLEPDNIEAVLLKSKILIRFGRFSESEKMLLQVSEQGSDNWNVWNLLGVSSDLQNNYVDAVAYYKKALKLNGTEPDIYNNLGYSYIMVKDFDQAITYLHIGLQYKPSSERLRNNLAIAYAWKRKYEKALEVLLAFLPETDAYNNIGYIAMLNEDYKIAKKYYKEAINYSPVYYRKATLNLEKLKSLQERKKREAQQSDTEPN